MQRLSLALLGGIPFTLYTLYVLMDVGFFGLFQTVLSTTSGTQVFVDLVIAALFGLAWLIPDARARGLSLWPWILLTAIAGSIGLFGYLGWSGLQELRAEPSSAI